MKKGLVSAVITTHNRLDYLKKAILSVKKQTYQNIEIIIIDDASSDGTQEFCKKEKGLIYKYISPENHVNGNYARNLGIKYSNGEYIAFLDDDDEWYETKIEKQVTLINQKNNCGCVYTGRNVEVNDGEYYYKIKVKPSCLGNCKIKCLYTVFSTTSTMLFTRKCLYDVGLFDENVNFWQETELMIRVCQKYNIYYIDEELILYRQKLKDPSQLTNNINGFLESVKYINEKHKNLIVKLSKEEKKKREGLIYQDIANRYTSLGMSLTSRKYLLKLFFLFPSFKKAAKLLLNYTNPTQLKFKMFYHNLLKKKAKKTKNKHNKSFE